jgi:hypothetical protein
MKEGQYIAITPAFSITKRMEVVRVIKVFSDYTYDVQYPNGHIERLPIGAFLV